MSLQKLGILFGTDKAQNGMLDYYEKKLQVWRNEEINLLEVGVFHGASLRTWREFFPKARVYGLDAFQGKQGNGHTFQNYRQFHNEVMVEKKYDRIHLIECDQADRKSLEKVRDDLLEKKIQFHFILDDGSHLMKDQQQTLGILAPCIVKGGYYFMEDWGSSIDAYPDVEPTLNNSTLTMMLLFNHNGRLHSRYMTEQELLYLEDRLGKRPIEIWHNNTSGTATFLL